ncbi:hypothetical protein HaLaN_19599 [Haematococcus lacustris]|uniref:Uncharacterized protein n=1 Tax=Haematococcus lacustris TaxID=44745 RepID=A0A699ZHI6_HAELA|nr:hypothetical protein HaLaN_19599 [Haematococcus lacustris]
MAALSLAKQPLIGMLPTPDILSLQSYAATLQWILQHHHVFGQQAGDGPGILAVLAAFIQAGRESEQMRKKTWEQRANTAAMIMALAFIAITVMAAFNKR